MATVSHANGLLSPPRTEKASSANGTPPRVVLAGKTGRILCVADIRGDYHELNRLIREHEATAVIHTGDFGFINADSLERMGDKILRHLLQYSPLIPPATRSHLLGIPASEGRAALIDALNKSSIHFPLSQFPHLLSGAITFPVPVFTVWGLIEDVRVLEKFRTGEYEVHNLSVLDEVSSRVIDVGGVKLRLFGLGGAVAPHKLFDNGEGYATIAGGQGTMWTTALQIGELVDTAARVYDPTETRAFISSAPVSRNGILSQVSNAIRADLTISGGLHFRYPASFNEFAVHGDFDSYRQKLAQARETFVGVYNSVKDRVDTSLNEQQQGLLKKALAVAQKVPEADDGTWTNTWHWVLSDASCGHILFSITDGRVSAETKSSGLNFSHRAASQPAPPSGPIAAAPPLPQAARRPSTAEPPSRAPAPTPSRPPVNPAPVLTRGPVQQQQHQQQHQQGMNNIRGIMSRSNALPSKPQSSQLSAAAAPAASSSTTPTQAQAVQSKGAAPPPRAPRGPPPNIANLALAAAGAAMDKPEGKPVSGKERTPTGPPRPANVSASINGKSPVPSSTPNAEEKPKEKESEKRSAVVPNGPANINGRGEAKATLPPAVDGSKESAKESKDGAGAAAGLDKPPSGPGGKRPSLYLKGLPVPCTEDEVKGMFGTVAEKIVNVKIIMDNFRKQQKDYAYVDFKTDEDLQTALTAASGSIRDTPVKVEISNPPTRSYPDPFRGRGRGSFRGARGGGRGGFASPVAGGAETGSRGEKKESVGEGNAEGKKEAATTKE